MDDLCLCGECLSIPTSAARAAKERVRATGIAMVLIMTLAWMDAWHRRHHWESREHVFGRAWRYGLIQAVWP